MYKGLMTIRPILFALTALVTGPLVVLAVTGGCRNPEKPPSDPPAETGSAAVAEHRPPLLSTLPDQMEIAKPWTGDLDGMIERKVVRALVVYSGMQYFFDGGTQRGIVYEALTEFERFLNKRLGRRTLQIHIVILPVTRDELIPALENGLGDIAAASLTVTPERRARVDFSQPTARDVAEVVVTGPAAPTLIDLDDLGGKTIHVRRSSSYWESLEDLNRSLSARGLEPVQLEPAVEYLEDEDLLEMVNGGLLPMAVVDNHKAQLWAGALDHIEVREDLAIRTGGEIAWAFRKDSPQLAEVVNEFVRHHRQGTLFGNVVLERYLGDTKWIGNLSAEMGDQRLPETIELFERYGDRYGFDPLLLAAVGFQESKLDQSKRSSAGAVGVMQIKPATAADPNVGIPDVTDLESNIHAGTKYLAFLRDRYFTEPEIAPLDRDFLTLAAYNAGPARVRKLRAEAAESGYDPNIWYDNVEVIAARRVGRETVRYVSNISKYWVAYRLVENRIAVSKRSN